MEHTETTILEVKERGPSPGILALLYFLLFVGGFAYNMASIGGPAAFPTPYQPVEKAMGYYVHFAGTTRAYSFFIFWSALPLGIFTATVAAWLRALNIHRGGTNIVLFGGYGAALFIALSGLCTWVLSQPGIAENAGATRAIQLLSFAAGGTGNVVLSGLLIAGISVAAGLDGLIPKWVMVTGLILAAISVLSMLNMVFPALSLMLPAGRFLGMIWMIIAGFTLKKSKQIKTA